MTSKKDSIFKDQPYYRGKYKFPPTKDVSVDCLQLSYKITCEDLVKTLEKLDVTVDENFFTMMKQYEDISIVSKPRKVLKKTKEIHQTKPQFEEKMVYALMYIPSEKRYRNIKIRLAPSNIKQAGIGAYALEKIPEGARGMYRGISKDSEKANQYYSWTVKSFDPLTGLPNEVDYTEYLIDATDVSRSNWTRYVNCGMQKKHNNFRIKQIYDKFYYIAGRDIIPGEELFIDYGPDYRRHNLKMKGKY